MNGDYRLENLGLTFYLGSFGPSVAALILTVLSGGKSGLTRLLSKLIRWRVGWKPYLIFVFCAAYRLYCRPCGVWFTYT